MAVEHQTQKRPDRVTAYLLGAIATITAVFAGFGFVNERLGRVVHDQFPLLLTALIAAALASALCVLSLSLENESHACKRVCTVLASASLGLALVTGVIAAAETLGETGRPTVTLAPASNGYVVMTVQAPDLPSTARLEVRVSATKATDPTKKGGHHPIVVYETTVGPNTNGEASVHLNLPARNVAIYLAEARTESPRDAAPHPQDVWADACLSVDQVTPCSAPVGSPPQFP